MSKGYVYIMTSSIDGLIKIGKSKDWNRRCQQELESNGYKNANGLKTYFVVEVDDQDEIESIMHDIFRESRVSNFELFAVDKDRAKRVLSKIGTQVYPEIENKVISNIKNTNKSKMTIKDYYRLFWKDFNNTLAIHNNPIKPRSEDQNHRSYLHFSSNFSIDLRPKENIIKITYFADEATYNKLLQNKNLLEKQMNSKIENKAYVGSVSKKMMYEYYIIAIENFDITNYDKKITVEVLNIALKFRDVINNYLKGN